MLRNLSSRQRTEKDLGLLLELGIVGQERLRRVSTRTLRRTLRERHGHVQVGARVLGFHLSLGGSPQ